eukprot:11180267-Lingulodinium_polyedra.AAC.1
MSGNSEILAEAAAEIFNDENKKRKALYTEIAKFLVLRQTVRSEFLPEREWKVLCGSGMGLPHSADLCDSALYIIAEKNFAAKENIQRAYKIKLFVRFRDDVLIIGSDKALLKEFYWKYRELAAKIFDMACEQMSRTEVTMLAVDIYIKNGKFHTKLRQKPNCGAPLCVTSAHPKFVEKWSRNYSCGISRLVSERKNLEEARELLSMRLQTYHFPKEIVDEVKNPNQKDILKTIMIRAGADDAVFRLHHDHQSIDKEKEKEKETKENERIPQSLRHAAAQE